MNLLKSEYLKFFYNKWVGLTVISTLILVPLFVIFLHESPSVITEEYALSQVLESLYLGQAGLMMITILYMGQEFSKSTLRSSLIANPKRWQFLFTKLFVLLSVTFLIWAFIIFSVSLVVQYYYSVSLSLNIVSLSIKVVFASISLVIICFCLILLTKSVVFSIGIALSFLLGLGQMLLQFSIIFLYFPILSTMNIFLFIDSPSYLPSSLGIIVQTLWAIVLFLLSLFIFKKRGVR